MNINEFFDRGQELAAEIDARVSGFASADAFVAALCKRLDVSSPVATPPAIKAVVRPVASYPVHPGSRLYTDVSSVCAAPQYRVERPTTEHHGRVNSVCGCNSLVVAYKP